MIIDLLLLLVNAVVFLLYQIFSFINFVIPVEVNEMIVYFVSYLGYVRGFFDVDTFITVSLIYLNFLFAFYTFRVIMWVYAHLPWIGKHHPLPVLDSESSTIDSMGRRSNTYRWKIK